MLGQVIALRRYPVKSMGGEELTSARVGGRGLEGDRWYAVEDADGRFASGKNSRRFRRRDAVFSYRAETGPSGVTVHRGDQCWDAGSPDLDRHLSDAMGAEVRLTPEAGVMHHDEGPVSLVGTATLRWCAERWGIDADPRRLRVNVVVETDQPFLEEEWVGRSVAIGGTVLEVVEPIPRCRMIDIAQDGVRPDGKWLHHLAAERDLNLAVCARVERPGAISLGDPVEPLTP